MVELIIDESGFPMSRPTLKKFQESFKLPLDEIFNLLPGARILSGFLETDNGDGTVTVTAGFLAYKGKVYTFLEYTGPPAPFVYFYKNTFPLSFNVGTGQVPDYQLRDGYYNRTATFDAGGSGHVAKISIPSLYRERKIVEFYKSGTTIFGNLIQRTEEVPYEVAFEKIPTDNYIVVGNFRPIDPNDELAEGFTWHAKDKSDTGFNITVQEVRTATVPVFFDWSLIAISK